MITKAVKKEVITPIDKVTAKPLTGPVPKNINIKEAINVVILASNIVLNALL